MKICLVCGDKLLDQARKCPTCGNKKSFTFVDSSDKKAIAEIVNSVHQKNSNSRSAITSQQPAYVSQAAQQRIKENKKNGVACCPKCGSSSISAARKGFGFWKAAVGVWAFGAPGAVAGAIGSKKVEVTCLNCGHRWKM